MRCSNKTLGLFLFFLLVGFITGQGMATDLEDHNFWGLTADDVLGVDEDSSNIDVLRRMFYQSNPETGTLHPDIKFSNLDVYWEDFWDTEELVFQFDLIAPAAIAYGGFYCRHTNGLPIGGSEQGFTCSSFEYATNQIAAPEKLVEALVPGETYAWNAFIIYEDEVIESPLSYFVYEDVRYDDRVEGPNTPVILMQSEDLTADQWDEVTLIVLADVPRGELAYQWYRSPTRANRGGIRIDGATQSYYVAPTEEALSQYYYCTVTNVADSSYGTELTTVASKSIEVNLRPV